MTRVLIAEDEPDIRALARLLLELSGHEVLEAVDGDAALEILAADRKVDVVLLDLRLPGRDGWQVMSELRASRRLADVRVVVFSAEFEAPDLARAKQHGAVGYLSKPFSEAELLAVIEA